MKCPNCGGDAKRIADTIGEFGYAKYPGDNDPPGQYFFEFECYAVEFECSRTDCLTLFCVQDRDLRGPDRPPKDGRPHETAAERLARRVANSR